MNRPSNADVKLKRLQNRILTRKGLLGCGSEFTVALHGSGQAVFIGANRFGQEDCRSWHDVSSIVCAGNTVAGILKDGTVCFAGQKDYWSHGGLPHICGLSCSETHVAVLLRNGRVEAWGTDSPRACETADWPDVIDVVCGNDFTVGLTDRGRIFLAGGSPLLRRKLESWKGIAGIFTDYEGKTVYGITAEGTLIASSPLPVRVSHWKNLIFAAASGKRIYAVTAAGQLLSTQPGLFTAGDRSTYISCALSDCHAVALTREGLVLSEGQNDFGQCNTPRFGALFESFEDFSVTRQESHNRVRTEARAIQAKISEAARYQNRIYCGQRFTACITADGRLLSSASFQSAKNWSGIRALAGGNAHLAALHEDGHVSADGNNTDGCTDVADWKQIRAVAAGKYHTLGLTEDGRVLFCGRNSHGQGDVTEWSGIRRVYAADTYTVGLGYDGYLRVAGTPPFDRDTVNAAWKDPLDVAVTSTHMAALYADGTVRSTRTIPASGKPGDGEVWDTCSFRRIRAIAAGEDFTVGLGYGGRAVAVGRNTEGQCNVEDWKDVVFIACGKRYTVGLTADGRVLFTGVPHRSAAHSSDGKTEENYRLTSTSISSWREIVALTAGPEHIVAMNREGAVLAMGLDEDGQCSATAHYTLFRDPRQLYGYGKYRLVTDDTAYQTDAVAPDAAKADSDQPLIPFARFSAHLRADTERLLKRLTGTEDRLTVLTEDGSSVTYRYESGELLRDALPSPVVSLSCGGNGSFLVCEDGTVRVRGELTRGSPLSLLPDKLGDSPFYRVKAIAGGANHTAVLLTDGTVSSYGENDLDQCDTDDWRDMVAIAVGDGYTVGLRKDGTVEAAGGRKREPGGKNRGRSAQGVAHLPRANPCAVDDWKNVCGISCNGRVTLGLCADGTVKAVGSSHYGQCNTDSWRGVVSVATSGNHTVALFGDGHVEAVGLNESGECRTESWSRVVQIAVMPELTLGLRSDGKVLAAGKHHEVLHTLDTVRAIACFGQNRQVFVMSDGTLRVHRRGSEFLPDPLEGVRAFIPSVADSVLHRYTVHAPVLHTAGNILGSFAVGMAHTLTLGKGGAIIATGAADNGQCDIRAYGTAVQVAAGAYHSAVLLADGRVILSGDDSGGKSDSRALNRELDTVGVDAEESRGSSVPTVVEHDPSLLPYAWRQVACGLNHTAALRSDGRVYAIGQNPDGRCDTRKWRNVTRITCGIRHTVAVTAEGTCVAAGDNRYGQCDTALWKNITMAAAGEYHTVALRADGCVEAAGDNRKGQCRVEDLRNIVSVACLPEATLCVTAEGRVIIRGGSGQHDKAVEALREVVAIHTCEHRIAALTVDRRVILIP